MLIIISSLLVIAFLLLMIRKVIQILAAVINNIIDNKVRIAQLEIIDAIYSENPLLAKSLFANLQHIQSEQNRYQK